ncbi:MAG: YjbQ family protein [Planctomycetes bacterium]|nr:YjbQ family protein [Planctomycetota bacterium]
MKSHTEYLTFNIPSKMAFRNITPEVEAALKKSGVLEGIVLVNSMHITASVFINDNESGLHHDFGKWLEVAPFNPIRAFFIAETSRVWYRAETCRY